MSLFNFVIGQRVLITKAGNKEAKVGIILNRGKADLNKNATRAPVFVREVNVYSVQTGKNKVENFGENEIEFIPAVKHTITGAK